MKFVTYLTPNGTRMSGEWRDGQVYTLSQPNLLDIIHQGEADPTTQTHVMPAPTLTYPYRPNKILCVGRNYAEHAAELGNQMPDKPLIFSKYPTSVIGTGDLIEWKTGITQKVDWEGELGVIIGKTAKNITEQDAYDVIFGYAIANDVSARDLQDSDKQWARAKGMDTFCPFGPVIVTKDDVADPHALTIETRVNDEVMQKGYTGDMFFKIPYLVAYLSQTFTLEPGDLILTGTPAGVGKGMTPPRFLKDGDVVSVTITGLGTLTNTCKIVD